MKDKDAKSDKKPRIILIVPRGEAVRNFLYSDSIRVLGEQARVTILSVIVDEEFLGRFQEHAEQILPLPSYREHYVVAAFRALAHEAHFTWLDSGVARNSREIKNLEAKTMRRKSRRRLLTSMADILAHRRFLSPLTDLERELTWRLRPTDSFTELFKDLQPDLVFNCSHIHGPAGSLPTRAAHRLGIPTVGFIFSWDNLTSRSRIFEPYDYYFVWHENMRNQLMSIYPEICSNQVIVTGTPQFDFHFKPAFLLDRQTLCQRIGIDSQRPYILYTTGVDRHFPEEHLHIAFIADFLKDNYPEIQLVVRTYIKGIGEGTKALAAEDRPNVIFPPVQWEANWYTPKFDDQYIYTSLLQHAAMGINPASTVSLELMMFDKPIMNIGFDPPGSQLPHHLQWQRHIEFDHYRPVADSGAVMVAYSTDDVKRIITRALEKPAEDSEAQKDFLEEMFGCSLDGLAGERIGRKLLQLAQQ